MLIGFLIAFYSGVPGIWIAEKMRKNNTPFFHSIRDFELTKKVNFYKLLGLNFFVMCIKNTFFRHFNKKIKISQRLNISEANMQLDEMTVSEACHLFGFLVVIIFQVIFFFYSDQTRVLISSSFFNVIFNVYPILLQERNKLRIRSFLTILETHHNRP